MYEDINEEWKPVPKFGYKYEVSTKGRVYNKFKDKFMKVDPRGNTVTLSQNGNALSLSVHSLMGCTFLGQDIDDPYRNRVLFKDKDSTHLDLSNLYIEDTSDLPGEVWKQVKYAAGRPVQDFYYVSNLGRMKSINHHLTQTNGIKSSSRCTPEMILSQNPDDKGYYDVWLSALEKPDITAQVHRLVAAAFCSNDDPVHKNVVNHIDGNPSNNRADNLEWCTPSENAIHAIQTGLKTKFHKRLRYPVRHVETDKIYNSMSDVDRAIGRPVGYTAERIDKGQPVLDLNGEVWTLEIFKDMYRKTHTEGQHCTIDEFPGKEFISLGEASLAIGRWEGYISDGLKRGSVIRNKAGQEMHVHLIGAAPVVGANEVYKQKKEAGLIAPPKERIKSKWAPRKSIKHVETSTIYSSFAEAERAMGRNAGYISDCFSHQRDCVDCNGNIWTFEFLDKPVKVHYRKNPCYFEEFPEQEFNNMTEASYFLKRCNTYINDRVRQGKPIISKDGQEMHIHFIEQ